MKKWIAVLLACALMLTLGGCELEALVQDILDGSGGPDYGPEETMLPIDQVLDLSQATKVEKFYEDYYVFTGVTAETAESYSRQLADAGYVPEESRHTIYGSSEENFLEEFWGGDWGALYSICFYKDTMVLGLDMHSYFRGDLWKLAGVPEEQISEYARWETPEDTVLPDWSAATSMTIGDYACRVLTDVPYQQVENYALWQACRKDIFGGAIGFDNHPIEDRLFIQELIDERAAAYSDYQVVVWYDGTAILADIPGTAELDEYVFWTHLNAHITLGENFLRKELLMVATDVLGSGHGGFGTAMYSHSPNCDEEDFERLKAAVIRMGYTEEAEESAEGGGRRYFAMRKVPCGDGWYMEVYYELILEADGYLEAEVSFYPKEGTNRD